MTIDSVWGNLFKRRDLHVREYLLNVPIFHDLSSRELGRLERYVVTRKFMQNEYIFRQSEPGAGMYIITSGTVNIRLEHSDGCTQNLVSLGERDFFGEMALLDESPRSAAAIVETEKVTVLSFFRGDLLKVKGDYPDLACKILWNIGIVLSERLRVNNELLRTKSQSS